MYQLNPASLDSDNNSGSSSSIYKKSTNNRTYKNKAQVNFSPDTNINQTQNQKQTKEKIDNVSKLISNLHSSTEDESDSNEDNNFNEGLNAMFPSYPSDTNNASNQNIINNELNKMNSMPDNNIKPNEYLASKINSVYSNLDDSYKGDFDYITSMTNMNSNGSNKLLNNSELLSKLDYIVHLLEEQRNEKTNTITEELILYLFLGIFIIFVLDSFARASKYVR
jgi:hypothetical protein